MDITTWGQRGIAVPSLDDSQSGGGCDRCVLCFYNPRFVLLHTHCGIVTVTRLVGVYRETTRGRVSGVESEEDCLNDRQFLVSLVLTTAPVGVNANALAMALEIRYGARVKYGGCESDRQEFTNEVYF